MALPGAGNAFHNPFVKASGSIFLWEMSSVLCGSEEVVTTIVIAVCADAMRNRRPRFLLKVSFSACSFAATAGPATKSWMEAQTRKR